MTPLTLFHIFAFGFFIQKSASLASGTGILGGQSAFGAKQANNGRKLDDVVSSSSLGTTTTCEYRQVGTDFDGDHANDVFGEAVAISGDGKVVAAGAPGVFANENALGYVRVIGIVESGANDEGKISFRQLGEDLIGVQSRSGNSLALSFDGSVLAIGEQRNSNENGDNVGKVRVFQYNATVDAWTQLGQDINGEAAGDFSGGDIALNDKGNILAIGASLNDGVDAVNATNSNRGHVRVYRFSASSGFLDPLWIQIGQDIDGEADSSFGHAVSLSSDGVILAVGAPKSNAGESKFEAGKVAVFRFHNETWVQLGNSIDGLLAGDRYGSAVSLNGNGAIVAAGARLSDDNGGSSGNTRVFILNGSNEWIQLGNTVVGEKAGDVFGGSVSLSADGTTLAVGAIFNDGRNGRDSGSARVFTFQDAKWRQLGRDLDGESSQDGFGVSVVLSADGSLLVVGGPGNDGPSPDGEDNGHVRVFALESVCPPHRDVTLNEITMSFTGARRLNTDEIGLFENITKDWYEDYFNADSIVVSVGVRSLLTNISIQDQILIGDNDDGTETSINSVVYSQSLSYVELDEILSVEDLILRPFQDISVRQQYGDLLTSNIAALSDIRLPVDQPVVPTTTDETPVPDTSTDSQSKLSNGAIVGIAVGSLAIGLIGAGLAFRRYKGSLPVGELVQTESEPARPSSSTIPIVDVEVLGTASALFPEGSRRTSSDLAEEGLLPEFKDQVRNGEKPLPPAKSADPTDTETTSGGPQFKDQVRGGGESIQIATSSKPKDGEPPDLPDFKDQCR